MPEQQDIPPRVLAVDSAGVVTVLSMRDWERMIGLTPEMSFATDILMDAHMLDEKRIRLLQACERNGDNPVAFARHLVKLNRALKTP